MTMGVLCTKVVMGWQIGGGAPAVAALGRGWADASWRQRASAPFVTSRETSAAAAQSPWQLAQRLLVSDGQMFAVILQHVTFTHMHSYALMCS